MPEAHASPPPPALWPQVLRVSLERPCVSLCPCHWRVWWQPLVARLLSRIEVLRWGARPSIPGRIPHLQLTWRCQYQQPLNELGGWRRWGLGRNLPPIWGHNSPRGMALMMAEGQWGVPVGSKAGSGGKETTTHPRSHPGSPGWQALSRIRGTLFISFLYFEPLFWSDLYRQIVLQRLLRKTAVSCACSPLSPVRPPQRRLFPLL